MKLTASGGPRVSVFAPAPLTFQADSRSRSRALHDRDNVTTVLNEQEFGARVDLLLKSTRFGLLHTTAPH